MERATRSRDVLPGPINFAERPWPRSLPSPAIRAVRFLPDRRCARFMQRDNVEQLRLYLVRRASCSVFYCTRVT